MKKNLLLLLFTLSLLTLCSCKRWTPKYVIGVSQCSFDNWREKMNSELQSSAAVYGNVKLDILSANDDSELQKKQIEEFINRGVDLLIVAPNQVNSIAECIDKAHAKGIPVIYIDRKSKSDKYTAFIGADNYDIGFAIGKYMLAHLNGGATVVEFQGLKGSSPAVERHRGFLDAMKLNTDITVVDGGYSDWTEVGAMESITEFLKNNPDLKIDAVFGHNDRIAKVAYRFLSDNEKHAGTQHAVPLFAGIDALAGDDGGLQMVIDGKLDATSLYPTRGDIVINVAMNILKGEPYERYTQLKSVLITDDNADAVLAQTDDMMQMQQRIANMNKQIDRYLEQFDYQNMLLTLCIVIALLLVFIVVLVYREQVKKRQRAVAETNERLRFFTNVSHEFRTPLTLIADPLKHLATEEHLSDEGNRMIALARRQADIMLQLVGQILDLRKIQNKHMAVHLQEADLGVKIVEWVDGFKPMASTKGISFVVTAPETFKAVVDVEKIERITYNLLSNALKYAPNGTSIDVSLTIDTAKNTFAISITDHGKGIEKAELPFIFKRFYQAQGAAWGSGIGLALVHDFVEVLHGTIQVDSELGHHTTFRVELPVSTTIIAAEEVAERQVVIDEAENETVVVDEELNNEGGDLVLVVDDNDDIRHYLHQLLKGAGYRVLEAQDGEEALKTATEQIPDIVVSDVMMPVMDGREFCSRLKTQTPTSHIPVILLTAQAMDEQRVVGYEVGADGYLTKPFDSQVLLSRVSNLLKGRRVLRNIFAQSVIKVVNGEVVSEKENAENGAVATAEQTAGEAEQMSAAQVEDKFLTQFREIVEAKMTDSNFSVETLAAELNLSRVQMYRKIKALTGTTPVDLIREARLLRADKLLASGKYTVSEVAYKVGFSSPSYFTKCYKDHFNRTPTKG